MEISEAIAHLVDALGEPKGAITLGALAERINVSARSVYRWHAGDFEPDADARAKLYQLAREVNRDDLAQVFLTGGKKELVVLDHRATTVAIQSLPSIRDFFARASMILTKAECDKSITPMERTRLIGEALQSMLEGQRFTEQLMVAVQNQS